MWDDSIDIWDMGAWCFGSAGYMGRISLWRWVRRWRLLAPLVSSVTELGTTSRNLEQVRMGEQSHFHGYMGMLCTNI